MPSARSASTDTAAVETTTRLRSDSNGVSARRLKKREIDRRCQRQARERTKSRIAYLEGLVEELKRSEGDERSAALFKRLADTERERDEFAQTLRDVQKALGTHGPEDKAEPEEDSPDMNDIEPYNEMAEADFAHETTLPSTSKKPSVNLIDKSKRPPAPLTGEHPPSTVAAVSTVIELDEPIVPKTCDEGCDCCRDAPILSQGPPKNLWRYANKTLLEPYKGNYPITQDEDLLTDDIPVRVVLEGWDTVDQQIGLPVSWQILRRIDESMFSKCGPVNRLAILTTMHLLLQYHREPTDERKAKIPPWYLPRPSSEAHKHSYAINFFVWPGLRERFVFHQHHYCANIFWQLFSASICMNWPYDFRDCFAQRWDTGTYEVSPLFRTCMGDISNWQMRHDLFERFPELRADIPATLQSARPMSNLMQMQLASMDPYTQARQQKPRALDRRSTVAVDNWDMTTPNLLPYGALEHGVTTPWIGTTWIS